MEYTLDVHRERLTEMLQQDEPCLCCPKRDKFLIEDKDNINRILPYLDFLSEDKQGLKHRMACNVCRKYVGSTGCPCYSFGKDDAIRITIECLKRDGYL